VELRVAVVEPHNDFVREFVADVFDAR
jgi:hypothetical protein